MDYDPLNNYVRCQVIMRESLPRGLKENEMKEDFFPSWLCSTDSQPG